MFPKVRCRKKTVDILNKQQKLPYREFAAEASRMALATEDFEKIGDYIKEHISDWLEERSIGKPPAVCEIELCEPIIRVEEELTHPRELMHKGFEVMKERFEQVDRRFAEQREDMNSRFECLTKRMDRFMFWSFGITISMGTIVIAVLKFWK